MQCMFVCLSVLWFIMMTFEECDIGFCFLSHTWFLDAIVSEVPAVFLNLLWLTPLNNLDWSTTTLFSEIGSMSWNGKETNSRHYGLIHHNKIDLLQTAFLEGSGRQVCFQELFASSLACCCPLFCYIICLRMERNAWNKLASQQHSICCWWSPSSPLTCRGKNDNSPKALYPKRSLFCLSSVSLSRCLACDRHTKQSNSSSCEH